MQNDEYNVLYWETAGIVMTLSQMARKKINEGILDEADVYVKRAYNEITDFEDFFALNGDRMTPGVTGGIRKHIGRVEKLLEATK